MNSKELLNAKFAGMQIERQLFCPAIYEHKARLIGKSVGEVATDVKLLEQAIVAEYETYHPDMLTVGIDIYNVEAQALGAEIVFPDAKDMIPSIKEKILKDLSKNNGFRLPNICKAGRIPLFLEVATNINIKYGKEVLVRGAVSGPYSIAAELMGIEPLIMAATMDVENCCKLLDFTTSFAIAYGKEYIKRGISVCLFDSQASPPLISPDMFKNLLLPRIQRIAREFKAAGCEYSELVIGGKTDSVAKFMLRSGFDIILSDYTSNARSYFFHNSPSNPLIRRNIDPVLIEQGDFNALHEKIADVKQFTKDINAIIGTGILSYNTPIENILKVKKLCIEKQYFC
jgi:uroporphyrinogen decarboxylase